MPLFSALETTEIERLITCMKDRTDLETLVKFQITIHKKYITLHWTLIEAIRVI